MIFYLVNPHPYANQKISYEAIAKDTGLSAFWLGGSKLPAINYLLNKTLETKRNQFCNLIVEIVNRGMIYRKSKKNPITREEIVALNELIRKIGFKIPDLWNPNFLNSLPSRSGKNNVKSDKTEKENKNENENEPHLKELLNKFLNFDNLEEHKRGYAFEEFLKELFDAYGLKPRSSFRLVGEQIDGSLELDNNTYLICGMSLTECIRKKARWAAETGEIYKSAYELLYVEY